MPCFSCMVFAELLATESKRKIQNEKDMPPPEIEPAIPCFPAYLSSHSAMLTVNDLLLKFLHLYS